MNHFDLKKTSQDFLDEMRTKSGKRSQTTRRLIRKIQHESNKSRHSNYEAWASVPTLASVKKNLFDYANDDEGFDTAKDEYIKAINEETKSKEDGDTIITQKKNKCFEYSVHKVAASEDYQQTASGNINPITDPSLYTPKAEPYPSNPTTPLPTIPYNPPQLDYSISDFPGSKLPYHVQTQVIHKLNQEVQKLLYALSQLDQECTSLRYQLHASQVELTKTKLKGTIWLS